MTTNNAAQTTLGYINRRYGSDVRSKEIFQDGEKYYIVEVEKRPGEVQPEFHVGGFAAHCSNTEDVWYYGKVVIWLISRRRLARSETNLLNSLRLVNSIKRASTIMITTFN